MVVAASAGGPPLVTGLIGLGSGALFLLIGLLIATGYRGFARKFFGLPSDSGNRRTPVSPDALLDGDRGRWHLDRWALDQVMAAGFIALGGLAFISGLVALIITLSR